MNILSDEKIDLLGNLKTLSLNDNIKFVNVKDASVRDNRPINVGLNESQIHVGMSGLVHSNTDVIKFEDCFQGPSIAF